MSSPIDDAMQIKIFILYLLDRIGYPIDYKSIESVLMQDGRLNYFDMAECFFALVDSGLIRRLNPDGTEYVEQNTPDYTEDEDFPYGRIDDEPYMQNSEPPKVLYEVTERGKFVATELSDSISQSTRERSYRSALRFLSFKKHDITTSCTYSDQGRGYLFNCTVKEKGETLLSLSIHADNDFQLNNMIKNFNEAPETVFRGLLTAISGDLAYIN